MNLLATLKQRFVPALDGLVADASAVARYADMVRASQADKFGDYQANCAMPLAKELGRKPQDMAREIVSRLAIDDLCEPPQIAGPGFINLTLKSEFLARQAAAIATDERLGVSAAASPRKYVIDFSSPNVAKPLHVGHLRSTIIGDSLTRILRFLGHTVVTDNHLGDWGTQFGMLLYGYKHFLDRSSLEKDPIGELVRLYLHVRSLTKGREDDEGDVQRTPDEQAHYERCLEETAKLQAGDAENLEIWRQFVQWTMNTVEPLYQLLDVRFDHYHGESFYNAMMPSVVQDLSAKGIAVPSQGALIVYTEDDPEGPVAIVRKRDGAFTYMTSDLATIRFRMTEFNPDAILYVVGAPQSHHFKQLFAIARRWNYSRVEFQHIAFGSVLGKDRKMLSTREGGAVELSQLLQDAITLGGEKYEEIRQERVARGEDVPELSVEERRQIAEGVGIGAVKYADLSQNRTSDYVFDWNKMLATDGNSATYMQYAYARCRSICAKGNVAIESLRREGASIELTTPHERFLALQILRFPETLQATAADYTPHLLTSYLWDLAKSYSGFFVNCQVLKAETQSLRNSRLLLCDLTARTIHKSLNLLGIRTLERM